MSYEYDVFLSYPRDPDLESWIDQYFIPRLHSALKNATLAVCKQKMGKIFFDASGTEYDLHRSRGYVRGIEPGQAWQQELERVISVSRCMVALWSPTYFDSPWCNTELQSFLSRQPKASAPVVMPLSIVKRTMLPEEVLGKYQVYDLHRYVIDGPSFIASDRFPTFLDEIRFVAEKVAKSICGAPKFEVWKTGEHDAPPPPPPVRVSGFV